MSEICQIIANPTGFMATAIVTACVSAFIILAFTKLGLRDKVINFCDAKGLKFFGSLLNCDFCLSFWLTVVLSVIAFLFAAHALLFLLIVVSPPLTRFLL